MVEFGTMKTARILSRDEWARLILGISLLLGLLVRLFPGLMAGFPLNDGGMFLVMIRDLHANDLALPAFTEYNFSNIPFAYPPLGLYFAVLVGAFGPSDIDILRWLPTLVNFLSIPAFYILAAALLNDRPRAAVATAFFALTPGSYSWQIMGGGLTRSFGMGFLILALLSVYQMFRRGELKLVLPSILFCSLAVLSHPEVSLATAASCALLWLFFGRNPRGFLQAGLVTLGTILLTWPWWGTVLAQHGPAPFLSVIHSGGYIESPFGRLYSDFVSPGGLFTLLGVLRITGLVWFIRQRQFFPIAWLVLPYFVEPRSALPMSSFAACLMMAVALTDGLPWAVDWARRKRAPAISSLDFTQRTWISFVLLGILFSLFVQSALYDFRLINTSLRPPAPQEALEWVKENTSEHSRFLVLTGSSGIMSDPIQEWFPALADRRSQTTLQGLEWTLGAAFFPRLNALVALQECRTVICVESWSASTGLDYSHILIQKNETLKDFLKTFRADLTYSLVYENPELVILEK